MQKWLLRLLVLTLIVYAGRELGLSFERAARDNDRARAEMAEHVGKKRAAEVTRRIEAAEAMRAEQLEQAVQDARP